jgi:hypothetical protein
MVGSTIDRETANFIPDLNLTMTNESAIDVEVLREEALMDEKVKVAIQLTVLTGTIQVCTCDIFSPLLVSFQHLYVAVRCFQPYSEQESDFHCIVT